MYIYSLTSSLNQLTRTARYGLLLLSINAISPWTAPETVEKKGGIARPTGLLGLLAAALPGGKRLLSPAVLARVRRVGEEIAYCVHQNPCCSGEWWGAVANDT